jgi:PPP family 3-phenylpropionic acid transporter
MSWRLPSFWFLYMAGLGLVYPFQALWFQESAGLTGTQLGMVLALRPIMAMLGQPLWGRLSDRTGARAQVLAGVLVCGALAYSVLPWVSGVVAIALVFGCASFFGTSVMPLGTSVSMAALGSQASARFGHVRVWGTVGYLILLVSFPRLLELWRERQGLADVSGEPGLGPGIFVGLAILSVLAAVAVGGVRIRGAAAARSRVGDVRVLLRHRPYQRILLFGFLAQLMLTGPIQFFSLLVAERGGDITDVANLWVPMLVVEIALVFLSGSATRRFGAKALIAIGIGADGLRWLLTLLAPDLVWMAVPQLLHGVVIAGLIIGSAHYVEQVVPDRLRSTGQAGFAMVGISFGTAFSNLGTGLLADAYGIEAPFLVGGVGAVLLAVLAIWGLPKPQKMPEDA